MKLPAVWRDLSMRIEAEFEVEANFDKDGHLAYPAELSIQTKLVFEKFESGKAYYKKVEGNG